MPQVARQSSSLEQTTSAVPLLSRVNDKGLLCRPRTPEFSDEEFRFTKARQTTIDFVGKPFTASLSNMMVMADLRLGRYEKRSRKLRRN